MSHHLGHVRGYLTDALNELGVIAEDGISQKQQDVLTGARHRSGSAED